MVNYIKAISYHKYRFNDAMQMVCRIQVSKGHSSCNVC